MSGDCCESGFERVELAAEFGGVVFGSGRRESALSEQGGDECVGIADDRNGNAGIEHPIQPEHERHALPGPHRGDDRRELARKQVAKLQELLDDFTRGEAPRRGGVPVVATHILPDGANFPPERADHLGEDIDNQAELPLDR